MRQPDQMVVSQMLLQDETKYRDTDLLFIVISKTCYTCSTHCLRAMSHQTRLLNMLMNKLMDIFIMLVSICCSR